MLAEADPLLQRAQRGGGPPVGFAGKFHECRYQRGADDECVHQHGECQAEPEEFDERHARRSKCDEDDGDEERCRRDDATGLLQTNRHGPAVVAMTIVLLLDSG